MTRRSRPQLVALALVGLAGCVLPRFELSGAELSWFAAESNLVDGEDALRVRSCEGAMITNVEFRITDAADDDRQKQFAWTCAEGFRTPAQFFTGASDVFVDLLPGSYRMTVRSADDPRLRGEDGETLTVSEDADVVAIGSGDATLIQWELHPAPVDLELAITGTDACAQLQATLVYADPVASLPDLEGEPEEAPDEPVVYRQALASEGGIALGGPATPCAQLQDGPDVVRSVDRGRYQLILQVDDQDACLVDVRVDARQGALALDLADPPC